MTCWSCAPDTTGPVGGGDAAHGAPAVPTARCARVAALVALLGSRRDQVRQRAVRELAELGPGVAGVLRATRRSRAGARLRGGALAALAELGWHELDPADRDLLVRFVRHRQTTETPVPLGPPHRWPVEWYALPTTDQAAVLDAFDLTDPVPATMRMGFAPWCQRRGWTPASRAVHGETVPTFEQVYVSPALDGWTLVFANYPALDGGGPAEHRRARAADAMHRCYRLSHRFGAAHWYAHHVDGYRDHSGWCVFDHGTPSRYCFYHPVHVDLPASEVLVGPTSIADLAAGTSPLDDLRRWLAENATTTTPPPRPPAAAPAESLPTAAEAQARLLRAIFGSEVPPLAEPDQPPAAEPDDEPHEPDAEDPDAADPDAADWEFSVSHVAWRLSVSPAHLGPDTHRTGTGVLAVPRALRDRPRYGALPI